MDPGYPKNSAIYNIIQYNTIQDNYLQYNGPDVYGSELTDEELEKTANLKLNKKAERDSISSNVVQKHPW